MTDNNQNNLNNQNNGNLPTPTAAPVLQASPSGGVVAVLQPGQPGFDDKIRAESERKDNFVYQAGAPNTNRGETAQIELPQVSEGEGSTVAAAAQESSKDAPPTTVLNYKIGNDLQKKQKTKWFVPVILGALGLFIVGTLGFYFYNRSMEKQRQAIETVPAETVITTLEYWGLWEPSQMLTTVLKDFETANPGISVNYIKKDINGYREALQSAIATTSGPDVFRYHASWRSYLAPNLETMPETVMTTAQFGQEFYPVMSEQLKNAEDQIQGMPLMYDSLAILYNKDLYQEAGLETPKTWNEFRANAVALTQKNTDGSIEVAGAALGLADNIDFVPDIIGLLAVQSGADLAAPETNIISDVLTFYTNFYNSETQRTWDETFDSSTNAFARGEVAMILAPSWLIHDIWGINPDLNVGVASVPQLDEDNPKEWATYWVEGVSANSPRQEAAWKLLAYLSSEEVLQALYEEQDSVRLFGEIYPRPSMADLLATDPYAQPYLFRASAAVGYPLNDKTFDNALDDANKDATRRAINGLTNERRGNSDNLSSAANQLINSWHNNFVEYGYLTE